MNDLPQSVDPTDVDQTSCILKQKRRRWFKIFALCIVCIGLVLLIWYAINRYCVSTDNAYVNAETAAVTALISAKVNLIRVSDTQQVNKNDILMILDDEDAKIALSEAEAQYAKAQRQFAQTTANSNALKSEVFVSNDAILSAKAELAKAKADAMQAELEYQRRKGLVFIGAISKEEFSSAQTSNNTAKANLEVAKAKVAQAQSSYRASQSNLDANNALIAGTTQTSHPDVLIAKAKVEQAKLDLARTVIRAPISGIVAQRNVQIGQKISAGTTLLKIVPIHQLYVDANFKESQLSHVRVGQSATLISDYYGDDVVYHGKVVGFAGGTGAAFALIPSQNATGNWIKVVQRLPVRIQLDAKELQRYPLRVGLSMTAKIDLDSR